MWQMGDHHIPRHPCALQTDCQEVATVVSATEIRTVAELLQVSPEGLQKAITFKVTVSAGWHRLGGGPWPLETMADVAEIPSCHFPTRKRCGRRFLPL